MDFDCEEEDRDLCNSRNCICACAQIAKIARECRETYFDHRDYFFLTLFEVIAEVKLGTLLDYDVERAKSRIRLKLRRLNIPGFRAIGGFDIQQQDYIDDKRNRMTQWKLHWHILCIADIPKKELKAIIYPKFNSGKTKRIALLKTGDDQRFGCTYLFKPLRKFKKKLSSSEKGQQKWQYPVKGKAKRELKDFLKRSNRLDWIILIGFRRYGNKIVRV